MKKLALFLLARLKEPSTHATILAILVGLGIKLPENAIAEILVGMSMVLSAILGLVLPEKKA